MSENYNAEYYHQYDVGIGKVEYETSQYKEEIIRRIFTVKGYDRVVNLKIAMKL